jgi:hypothetical protein
MPIPTPDGADPGTLGTIAGFMTFPAGSEAKG